MSRKNIIASCRRGLWLVVFGWTSMTPALGQPVEAEVIGYVKDLAIRGASTIDGSTFFLNTARSRLQLTAGLNRYLSAEVWLDTEVLAGSFIDTEDYKLSRALAFDEFADLDWIVDSTDAFVVSQRLFRLTATASLGKGRLVVGRQRIAWGSGFVWTPTDVLNPVSPVAIERDEKAGVDAAYVDYSIGPMSRVEVAFAPSRNSDRTSIAGRASAHMGEFDVAAMGGRIRDSWVIGGDFAGYVGNAGLRGEVAVTSSSNREFVRAVINADYNFPGDYYAFVEWHFNGAGTRNRNEYDFSQLLSGQSLNLAKDYVAVSVSKSVTPLVGASFYGILNADDGSGLVGPAIIWSAKENLEISASAYVFYGAEDSEYGRARSFYFAVMQYFF